MYDFWDTSHGHLKRKQMNEKKEVKTKFMWNHPVFVIVRFKLSTFSLEQQQQQHQQQQQQHQQQQHQQQTSTWIRTQ